MNDLIPTLKGLIPAGQLGRVQIHEHVFCRMRSTCKDDVALFLKGQMDELVQRGISTIVDVTTYVNPDQFYEALRGTGINIVCCAGYYLPRRVPAAYHHYDEDKLLKFLQNKISNGIGKYKIRPFMLKCAANGEEFSELEERFIRVVARAQRENGLPIQVHAFRGGQKQLRILLEEGVDPSKIILCHLEMALRNTTILQQRIDDIQRVVETGASILVADYPVSNHTYRRHLIQLITTLIRKGYLNQIFLSVDSYWQYRTSGMRVRGMLATKPSARTYSYLCDVVIPGLRQRGITDQQIDAMLIDNPRRIMTGRVLLRSATRLSA
jgi:phosphotriesterase-related protein